MEERTREIAPNAREIWLYSDGVYRWAYEKDLVKNRFEMNYNLKIVSMVFGLTWVLLIAVILLANMPGSGMAVAITTAACLGGGLLAAGIMLLVQRLSAKSRGGTDVICFEMDDDGLRQILSDKAAGVDRALSVMTALSGAVTGNSYAMTQSDRIVAGTHPNITRYGDVRRVRVCPRYDVIDVTLKGNYKCRVYAKGEDLDFVRDYIAQRVPRNVAIVVG